MKNFKNLLSLTFIGGALLFSQFANAQKISQKTSTVLVKGTSSLHDWEMTGSSATFSGTVSGNTINNVTFSFPVKNLKSAKGKMMDNKAYDALQASKAPNVTFTAPSINIGKSNAAGKLTIAGVTKNASFPINVVKKGDTYVIEGTEAIKMSEYGMSRPGFMGIKTGDDVTVKVNVVAE